MTTAKQNAGRVRIRRSGHAGRAGLRRGRAFSWVVLLLLIPAAGAGVFTLIADTKNSLSEKYRVLHEVKRTTFAVEVIEHGHLESAHNIDHFCEVEGRSGGRNGGTTILWVIPEGTHVKRGDLIVELDSSYLEEMIQTRKIAVEDAKSSLATARADVETAEKAVVEYETGIFVRERKTLEADVTVAEENIRRTKKNLEFTKELYKKSFVNRLELEAAEFAVRQAELNLDKATTSLDVLVSATKEKQLAQLRGTVAAKKSLLTAAEERLSQEQARLDKYTSQLDLCKIRAKADGMVVYFEPPGRWGPDEEEKIRAGKVVRERKNLIIIPDLDQMRLRMLVHESKISLVEKGQPVRIRVEALSEHDLEGQVELVGTSPNPGPWYDREKRNYPVLVSIKTPIKGLKPGMTAEGTIVTSVYEDVIAVPVQCVHRAGDESYCLVRAADGTFQRRSVQLGASNDVYVHIESGLSEGEFIAQGPDPDLPRTGGRDEQRVGDEQEPENESGPPPHARGDNDQHAAGNMLPVDDPEDQEN